VELKRSATIQSKSSPQGLQEGKGDWFAHSHAEHLAVSDSEFLTTSGCLWTKENDFSTPAGGRRPRPRLQLSKAADHRFERVEGLSDESRFPVLRYEEGFLLDDLKQLAVRERRKLGECPLHGISITEIPGEVQKKDGSTLFLRSLPREAAQATRRVQCWACLMDL